jgi:hypothetical protein
MQRTTLCKTKNLVQMRQQLHEITLFGASMFHVEQRAVEYVFHVERAAQCGAILRASFQLQRNLAINVAARPSSTLEHIWCITEWRLLHSGNPTSPREPWWIIVSAEPASHEECSTWNIVARTAAITCSGTALLRLPRFLKFSFAPCTSSTTTIVASTTVPVGGSQMLEPCFGTIDDQFRRKCRLNG